MAASFLLKPWFILVGPRPLEFSAEIYQNYPNFFIAVVL